MWQRYNRSNDQQNPYPAFLDPTYDERYLETIPEVNSIRSSQGTIATADASDLAFHPSSHPSPSKMSTDDCRSFSLYSQASPDLHDAVTRHATESSPAEYHDISPPDSVQDSEDDSRRGSPYVSPIDEEHPFVLERPAKVEHIPDPEIRFRSHLPVLRKVSPGVDSTIMKFGKSPGWRRTTPESADREPVTTKWDDFSGEPTDHADGKQASVQPGSRPFERRQEPQEAKHKKSQVRKPPRLQLDSLDNPVQREPWKGASGRTTLVNPVKNDPNARLDPLQVPKNRARKPDPGADMTSEATPVTPRTIRAVPPEPVDDTIKPVVPLKLGTNSPRIRSPITGEHFLGSLRGPSNPQLVTAPSTPTTLRPEVVEVTKMEPMTPIVPKFQESPTLGTQDPLKLKDAPNHSELTPPQGSPPSPHEPPVNLVDIAENRLSMSPEDQLSRDLSWTTFATKGNESPPLTPGRIDNVAAESPMPTAWSPLVLRKRPVPSRSEPTPTVYNAVTHPVLRKPTPLQQQRAASLFSTASSLSKALPQCPPEIEAADKIAALEARLDDLRHRRRNINQIMKELSGVIHPMSVAYDFAARAEFKRTLANLNDELAEIGQEEHEAGLRLHRAHKRRDKDALYENPTGLWIKRVTS